MTYITHPFFCHKTYYSDFSIVTDAIEVHVKKDDMMDQLRNALNRRKKRESLQAVYKDLSWEKLVKLKPWFEKAKTIQLWGILLTIIKVGIDIYYFFITQGKCL